ncbi:MAG: DegT/DnrJ/EryC1/StrS family aminotransferase, partial [Anaerolineales bacterium]|nr:DegT/DnrJ/EryC1/StrS family aminotransferase [Anaerolineales bacterium]
SLAAKARPAALHLAALALGLGPGDEVIVPSLTFVATANAPLSTGAKIRFADITSLDEPVLDPAAVEAAITPQTKAIIPMHYAGYPCDMEALAALAYRYGLGIIEDAAHAPGACLNGRRLGTWGDISCFSFFSNKNMATGEGGMVVTDRDDLADKARLLRSHGMTTLTWDRHHGQAFSYDVLAAGFNYRIDEMRAALGLVQLGKLSENNARRMSLTKAYRAALRGSGLIIPFGEFSGDSACHILPALLPEGVDRGRFMETMRLSGVQTSIHYPPIHGFSYYKELYPELRLPRTEVFAAREVTLPLYPTMSEGDLSRVVEAVNRSLR